MFVFTILLIGSAHCDLNAFDAASVQMADADDGSNCIEPDPKTIK